MPKLFIQFWALLFAILGLSWTQAEVANASTFEVSPVRLTLSEHSANSHLTVRNVSQEPLRFQVSAHAWAQDRAGAVKLSPTQDVVFFPTMLTLKPGETRHIRVSTLAHFGPKEQSYRIFVEELPPIASSLSNGIRVLTRFGIPLFLQPTITPTATPRIHDLNVSGRTFSFALENDGNTHFLTKRVRVQAQTTSGGILLDQELPAWYILAGGGRTYSLDLPAKVCGATQLVVIVESDKQPIKSLLPMSFGGCTP
jgi:fimbrial chaperone protein